MNGTSMQAVSAAAERIVRHFQAQGFSGITEAFVIQIRHVSGSRAEIDAAFEAAREAGRIPPIRKYFAIRPFGHFAEFRSFDAAKSAFKSDITLPLLADLHTLFFEPAPVTIDDPLADGSRYDVMMKLRDNADACAVAVLMNDPDASFLDYIGSHLGTDWAKIMGGFEIAGTALADELDVF